jgi:hypothetical protein
MQITKTLLVAALAAGGMAATAAEAQNPLSRGSGNSAGASMARSAPGRVDMGGSSRGHDQAASGRSHGHRNGRTVATGGRHWGGGGRHWSGGGHGHFRGSHRGYWGPRLGVYIGAPVLFGSYYWGSPYWDDYYYPRSTVIYRERIVEPYPESYIEEDAATTEVAPRDEGAPTQAPAYRNYCESAKAYYPKVTRCPEGWRFEPAPLR